MGRDRVLMDRSNRTWARRLALPLVITGGLLASSVTTAHAAGEEVITGAFDAITEVPIATIILGLMKEAASTSETPAVLDKRLSAVEAMVKDIEVRLKLVEARLGQLQNEIVKIANINRLREIQRIRSEVAEINAELRTHPTDESRRAILEFRAQQQVDELKNNVDFDIWQWTEIDPDSPPAARTIVTKFHSFPAFELYSIAIATWFSALELHSGTEPQKIVSNSGAGGVLLGQRGHGDDCAVGAGGDAAPDLRVRFPHPQPP